MKANTYADHPNANLPRVIALGLLAACLMLVFTGCQRRSPANPPPPSPAVELTGVYNLLTVDGKSLPCTLSHEGHEMTVNSGNITFTADGHCRTTMVIAPKGAPKDITVVRQASFQLAGQKCSMSWEGFGQTEGTLAGTDFTMDNEGMVFVYRK